MKRVLFIILLLAVLMGVIITHTGCKDSGEGGYYLSVNVRTGATGTPATGQYEHSLGDEVNYSYSVIEGYTGLRVFFDGEEIATSGTVTITGDNTLDVYAAQGSGDFLFSVATSTGVTGTPVAGYYYHDSGDLVDYAYAVEDGYTNLKVTLDSVQIPASGTVTVTKAHLLIASAEKRYEIAGAWTMEEAYTDGSHFTVTLTFTGTKENGTVTDSHGGTGIYTASGRSINFNLVFAGVSYAYTGTYSTDGRMSGTTVATSSSGTTKTGEWAAIKNETTTTQSRWYSSTKYN